MEKITFTKCKCCVVQGKFDIENIPLDCEATWKLISSGHTVGIFQIEKKLGQDWSRKVKPDNIEGLSALISLIRPGPLECISGDTKVLRRRCKQNGQWQYEHCRIDQLYEEYKKWKNSRYDYGSSEPMGITWNKSSKKWRAQISIGGKNRGLGSFVHKKDAYKAYQQAKNTKKKNGLIVMSVDEKTNTIFPNKINKIVKCGPKQTYRIKLKLRLSNDNYIRRKFYNIRATKDHIFLTLDGWKKLSNILPGEYIAINNTNSCHTSRRKDNTRVYGFKTFRDICLYHYKHECVFCSWLEGSLDTNHIEGNRHTNNDYRNLCFLCPNHHRLYSENKISKQEILDKLQYKKLPNTKEIRWVKFLGTEKDAVVDTFDIQVFGPSHNYIAGNFVVHNSGMSEQYVDVKSGKKEMEFLHPSLKPILEPTYSQMIYQEQSLKIAVEIAGFNPEEADSLRKSIGKKDAKLMAELKQKFITGSKKKGLVTPEVAEEIFSWIEKCQRYQFNKSHSVSYAMISYQTAWMKSHFPHEFFTSWLTHSHYKTNPKEEIYKLVQDARLFNVPILSPDIRRCNVHFQMLEKPDKAVGFGLAHIRSVGQSAIQKIVDSASGSLGTWMEFLASVPDFHRNVGIALIKAGACDCYGLSRSQMIHELEVILGNTIIDSEGNKKEIKGLTKREREWLFEHCSETQNMANILSDMSQDPQEKPLRLSQMKKPQLVGLGCSLAETMPEKASVEVNKLTKPNLINLIIEYGYQEPEIGTISIAEKRRAVLAEKAILIAKQLEDTNTSKAMAEKHFLGIALSCSPADDAETDLATHTCLDVARAFNDENITVCAIVDKVTHTKTKRGKNPGQAMCFLTISDSTYSTDAVVFPQAYDKNKGFCQKDSIVLIYGKKQNRSFIVSEIQKLI